MGWDDGGCRGGSLTGTSHQQGRNKRREEEGKFFTSRMSGIRCSILMGCSCGTDRAGLVGRFPPKARPPPAPHKHLLSPPAPPGTPRTWVLGAAGGTASCAGRLSRNPRPKLPSPAPHFHWGFISNSPRSLARAGEPSTSTGRTSILRWDHSHAITLPLFTNRDGSLAFFRPGCKGWRTPGSVTG